MDRHSSPPPISDRPLPAGRRQSFSAIRAAGWSLLVLFVLLIAVGIAMPMLCGVQIGAKITAASAQARGIYLGLMQYATDHDGAFPKAEHDANEAYRQLIPHYVENEKPFFVAGCRWHEPTGGKGPDNDLGEVENFAKTLETGENHWAYVAGLNRNSPASTPLIADGFSEAVGTYAAGPNRRGGVWKGKCAIVTYVDGSVTQEPLDRKTFRVLRDGRDMFDPAELPPQAKVLNPR